MNKRIQQLANEAGYTKDMFGVGHWDMLECKKFAELIVRECAEFANEHNEEIEGVTLGVGQALKKHFGVEE